MISIQTAIVVHNFCLATKRLAIHWWPSAVSEGELPSCTEFFSGSQREGTIRGPSGGRSEKFRCQMWRPTFVGVSRLTQRRIDFYWQRRTQ